MCSDLLSIKVFCRLSIQVLENYLIRYSISTLSTHRIIHRVQLAYTYISHNIQIMSVEKGGCFCGKVRVEVEGEPDGHVSEVAELPMNVFLTKASLGFVPLP